MNKVIGLLLVVFLVLSCCSISGCQIQSTPVLVNGSSSMKSVMTALQTEFAGQNKNIDIQLSFGDSMAGIQSVLNGECEIGLSSRLLTAPETFSGLNEYVFAYDAIVLIVNHNNPLSDLSVESLYKVFTGEVTNWSEVGGNSGEIFTVGRESGSGTRESFESLIDAAGKCTYDCEKASTTDVIEYVSQNADSIGYISLTAESDSVKQLNINGIQPCVTTVKNRFYPLRRPFVLITSDKTDLSSAAEKFYDYIISEKASALITSSGAVPVN